MAIKCWARVMAGIMFGVIRLTLTAYLPLRPGRRWLAPRLVDQLGEREQPGNGERAATGGDHHERIERRSVGPPGGKGEQHTVGVMQVDPVLTPVLATDHELEVLPEQRVKRVRHPHPPVPIVGIGCS